MVWSRKLIDLFNLTAKENFSLLLTIINDLDITISHPENNTNLTFIVSLHIRILWCTWNLSNQFYINYLHIILLFSVFYMFPKTLLIQSRVRAIAYISTKNLLSILIVNKKGTKGISNLLANEVGTPGMYHKETDPRTRFLSTHSFIYENQIQQNDVVICCLYRKCL